MPEAKPEGRQKFRSQFSMGQLDFERYDKLLSSADEYGVRVENGDASAIKPFFSILRVFYRQIKFIILDRKTIDALDKNIKQQLNFIDTQKSKDTSYALSKLLVDVDAFAEKVYELKQLVGLGIEVEKVLSQKKKWERAARID